MSFDLYFFGETLTQEALSAHFSSRPHYQVNSFQAIRENPDTGVHFIWDIAPTAKLETSDAQDVLDDSPLTLNVNFNRPLPFMREAIAEIEALARAFDIRVMDPQAEHDSPRKIDGPALMESYAKSAKWAASQFDHPYLAPSADIDAAWLWNAQKSAIYDDLAEDLFLPSYSFCMLEGEVKSCVIWGDGVPMLTPRVDLVMMLRDQTAPKPGWLRNQKTYLMPVPFDEFLERFGGWFQPRSTRDIASWGCGPEDEPALRDAILKQPVEAKYEMVELQQSGQFAMLGFADIWHSDI
jgi:hypothetical protein